MLIITKFKASSTEPWAHRATKLSMCINRDVFKKKQIKTIIPIKSRGPPMWHATHHQGLFQQVTRDCTTKSISGWGMQPCLKWCKGNKFLCFCYFYMLLWFLFMFCGFCLCFANKYHQAPKSYLHWFLTFSNWASSKQKTLTKASV